MAQAKKEPVHRILLGNIKALIWENVTKEGRVWFNVEIFRCYRDNGERKDATTFGRDDLPIVAKAADMAYAWIWGQQVPANPEGAVA